MSNTTISEYLTRALAGTLIGQRALARHLSYEQVSDSDCRVLNSLVTELDAFGVEPDVLAKQALAAITTLLIEPDNAARVTTELTRLLWTVLGDPESGEPPEIYRKAGHAMHLSFIGLLCPEILEPFLDTTP